MPHTHTEAVEAAAVQQEALPLRQCVRSSRQAERFLRPSTGTGTRNGTGTGTAPAMAAAATAQLAVQAARYSQQLEKKLCTLHSTSC